MHKKIPIAVLASGFGSNLQALINFSHKADSNFYINLVIANNPSAHALTRAKQAGIASYLVDHKKYSRKNFEQNLINIINTHQVKLIILAGFMRILSPDFLSSYPDRIINIHPSLLPKYPGLHGVKQALSAGDKIIGCTVHLVNNILDGGLILGQSSCEITNNTSLEQAEKLVHELEHELLPRVVNQLCASRYQHTLI